MKHNPLAFTGRTLRGFWKNEGLLLAGSLAYYGLLSLVPMLALSVGILSHWVERAELLGMLGRYVEWLVPSQSRALLDELAGFLESRFVVGGGLMLTMLFFSSMAFSVLQRAMAVIFAHRRETHKRHSWVSFVLPYGFVLVLGIALMGVTLATTVLQTLALKNIHFLGWDWTLRGLSGLLLYVLGFSFEVLALTAIYWAMPVGQTAPRHALIGGLVAASIWEILRHVLVWYFATVASTGIVYGSFTTAVVVLFSLEFAAIVLLLGAQVISEYEKAAIAPSY